MTLKNTIPTIQLSPNRQSVPPQLSTAMDASAGGRRRGRRQADEDRRAERTQARLLGGLVVKMVDVVRIHSEYSAI